jgi:hypothetical protein
VEKRGIFVKGLEHGLGVTVGVGILPVGKGTLVDEGHFDSVAIIVDGDAFVSIA